MLAEAIATGSAATDMVQIGTYIMSVAGLLFIVAGFTQ
jgi:hypothetical protein